MRKIGTKNDLESKRKRNNLILSIFMLSILVFSTAGYAIIMSTSTTQSNEVNSDQPRLIGNRWFINVDGRDLSFSNSPDFVKDVEVNIQSSIFQYQNQNVYLVSDNSAINSEIATILSAYSARIQQACFGPCEEDLPEKTCSEKLIIWKDSPQNKVYQEENCIFIEGDIGAVDAFLYKILNIPRQ